MEAIIAARWHDIISALNLLQIVIILLINGNSIKPYPYLVNSTWWYRNLKCIYFRKYVRGIDTNKHFWSKGISDEFIGVCTVYNMFLVFSFNISLRALIFHLQSPTHVLLSMAHRNLLWRKRCFCEKVISTRHLLIWPRACSLHERSWQRLGIMWQ